MPRHRTPNEGRPGCGQSGPTAQERFPFPASFYLDAYRAYRAAADAARENSESDPFGVLDHLSERKARVKVAIASKGIDAIPFILQMLRGHDGEECDDARGVLALMAVDGRVVDSLVERIAGAEDSKTVTALVTALGATGSARAIPGIARLLQVPGLDSATRQTAIASLGALTDMRFDSSDDPEAAVAAWLAVNGYRPVAYALRYPRRDLNGRVTLPGRPENLQVDETHLDADTA